MTLAECPASIQQSEKDEARASAIQMKAIQNFAEKHGVDISTARAMITIGTAPYSRVAVQEFAAAHDLDFGRAMDLVRIGGDYRPDQHLSADEVEQLLYLNQVRAEIRLSAATIAVQSRLLYPIFISSVTPADDGILLELEVPDITVFSNGARFKSDDGREIAVKEMIRLDGLEVKIESTSANLEPGDVFFLLSGRDFKIGNPDWTRQDTEQLLDIDEWERLAGFMLSEHPSRRPPRPEEIPKLDEADPGEAGPGEAEGNSKAGEKEKASKAGKNK